MTDKLLPMFASTGIRRARDQPRRGYGPAARLFRVGVEIAELEQLEVVHGLRPYAPKENP